MGASMQICTYLAAGVFAGVMLGEGLPIVLPGGFAAFRVGLGATFFFGGLAGVLPSTVFPSSTFFVGLGAVSSSSPGH